MRVQHLYPVKCAPCKRCTAHLSERCRVRAAQPVSLSDTLPRPHPCRPTRAQMKHEGPLALYKGFTPAYTRLAPHRMVHFMTLEQITKFFGAGEM